MPERTEWHFCTYDWRSPIDIMDGAKATSTVTETTDITERNISASNNAAIPPIPLTIVSSPHDHRYLGRMNGPVLNGQEHRERRRTGIVSEVISPVRSRTMEVESAVMSCNVMTVAFTWRRRERSDEFKRRQG